MRPVFVIFAKAPEPGRVKTRLIPAIGARRAAQLAIRMAKRTCRVVRQVRGAEVRIAYAASRRYPTPCWIADRRSGPRLSWFKQGRGDLGDRMRRAVARMSREGFRPIVLLGTDLPTLAPSLLRTALRKLRTVAVAVGPARDGGYYLIGLVRPMPDLFRNIPWSSAAVWPLTRFRLRRRGVPHAVLPLKSDLDRPEDLR